MNKHQFFNWIIYFCLMINTIGIFAQGFNYQAIVRDRDGNTLVNSPVSISIEILDKNNRPRYSETQNVQTDEFGLVSLVIGSSNLGNFQTIDWSQLGYSMNVKIDGDDMGTQLFQSVPYSKVATEMPINGLIDVDANNPTVGESLVWNGTRWEAQTIPNNATTLTAGTGIRIENNQIINDSPDRTITLNGTGGTSISGSYPNFIINSTVGGGTNSEAGVEFIFINPNNPGGVQSNNLFNIPNTRKNIASISLEVPGPGYVTLLLTGDAYVEGGGLATLIYGIGTGSNDWDVGATTLTLNFPRDNNKYYNTVSMTRVQEVSGPRTINYHILAQTVNGGTGLVSFGHLSLIAQYFPNKY